MHQRIACKRWNCYVANGSSLLCNVQESLMSARYTVSDGKLVLTLETAEEGGYVVTSPLDPELITQAESIEEAFANARDAVQALKQARVKLLRRLSAATIQR
jgi:antitoxin HicB